MIDRLPHSRLIRLVVLGVVLLSIAQRAPTPPGAGFVGCISVATLAWVGWVWRPAAAFAWLLLLAVAGGLATGAGVDAVPVAAVMTALAAAAAGEQLAPRRAFVVAVAGALSLAVASALADEGALAALALVAPGAGLLAGLARREYVLRVEQAEMLVAEVQRTREEQARAPPRSPSASASRARSTTSSLTRSRAWRSSSRLPTRSSPSGATSPARSSASAARSSSRPPASPRRAVRSPRCAARQPRCPCAWADSSTSTGPRPGSARPSR